jgi:hypothetical protein
MMITLLKRKLSDTSYVRPDPCSQTLLLPVAQRFPVLALF